MGWGGSEFFLAESQSRLYPHMRAKYGHDPTAVSKKLPFKFISRLEMHPLAAASRSRLFETSYYIGYAFCFESVASPNVNERYCSA